QRGLIDNDGLSTQAGRGSQREKRQNQVGNRKNSLQGRTSKGRAVRTGERHGTQVSEHGACHMTFLHKNIMHHKCSMFNRLEGLQAVRRWWMRRFKWSHNGARDTGAVTGGHALKRRTDRAK